MDFALVAAQNAISNLDSSLRFLVLSSLRGVKHLYFSDFEGELECVPGVLIIPTNNIINRRIIKRLESLSRHFYRAMGRSVILIPKSDQDVDFLIHTPFVSMKRIHIEGEQRYGLANNKFGHIALPMEFVESSIDLDVLWKRVLAHVHPQITKVIVSQNCHLISFDKGIAVVGVTSPQLFKLYRERIQKLSAAFEIVCKRKVSVKLQVMTNDQ